MAYTPKPIRNVAGIGTILPTAVTICSKRFPTIRTGKCMSGFVLHKIQMGIPPDIPTGIRAKPFSLSPRILHYRISALFTDGFISWSYKTMPSTKRLYRVNGNMKCCCDIAVSCPISTQGNNLLFLFVCHDGYLLKIGSSGVTGRNWGS